MPSHELRRYEPRVPDVRLGDGEYYDPRHRSGRNPELALAARFFLATENEVPEVRRILRNQIFPLLPERRVDFSWLEDTRGLYSFYADAWTPPLMRIGRVLIPPESNHMLPVIQALREWTRRFRLRSPYLMKVVVEALLDWYRPPREEKALASLGRWGPRVGFLAHGWSSRESEEKRNIRRFSELMPTVFPFQLQFSTSWQAEMETEQEFKTRIRERLERHLREYTNQSRVHLERWGYRRVPRKTASHHLDWLVQYQLKGLTYDAIADRHAAENPQLENPPTGDAVAKAVRRSASTMNLQLRA